MYFQSALTIICKVQLYVVESEVLEAVIGSHVFKSVPRPFQIVGAA